jgi:hypothetical protein
MCGRVGIVSPLGQGSVEVRGIGEKWWGRGCSSGDRRCSYDRQERRNLPCHPPGRVAVCSAHAPLQRFQSVIGAGELGQRLSWRSWVDARGLGVSARRGGGHQRARLRPVSIPHDGPGGPRS